MSVMRFIMWNMAVAESISIRQKKEPAVSGLLKAEGRLLLIIYLFAGWDGVVPIGKRCV
jgi:hypothetical protein